MSEFVSIAWPGLVVLGGLLAFVVHAVWEDRRRHPRGYYRSGRDDEIDP